MEDNAATLPAGTLVDVALHQVIRNLVLHAFHHRICKHIQMFLNQVHYWQRTFQFSWKPVLHVRYDEDHMYNWIKEIQPEILLNAARWGLAFLVWGPNCCTGFCWKYAKH